jgi:ATP-dependent RNA helicase SUPV3L1/SUV3
VASTVEMANLDKPIDCVMVDEVQLILDKNRGWAWSQALVGIPAKKIIMTGSEECIPTLKRLIEEYLEETLEIIPLERIGKLEVLKKPLGNISKVEPGSAVIAFSRRGVLALKKALEDSGRTVSVLYGNLSPGVRREEAKRFRSGETDVLVATDVIGMGLNLPIKTVIFSETAKFDGKEVRPLEPQEVKQIAGRAGRFGKFECGYVGVASSASLNLIHSSLNAKQVSQLESCFVRPTQTQLEVLRAQIGGNNIKSAMSLFSQLSKPHSTIVCSDLEEMLGLADRIEITPPLAALSFSDKYLFTCAPVSATDMIVERFIDWLTSYSKQKPVLLSDDDYQNYTRNGSTSEDTVLNYAENSVKILTLYHWLARKKKEYFPSIEKCEELREKINTFIENSLKRRGLHRKCPECSKKMSLHQTHKVCNDCYRSRKRYRFVD